MKARYLVLATALALAASSSYAQSESIRPLFAKENKVPELHAFEVNVLGGYVQQDESRNVSGLDQKRNNYTIIPQIRFGAFENVTLYGSLPYSLIRSDLQGDINQFQDATIGFELLAYEYTYKYPWVIPYAELSCPLGDDEDMAPIQKTDSIFGYSLGKFDAVFGIAVGTTVNDIYHYILDGRYNVNMDDQGIFSGSACFIWDLSDRFSVLAEAKVLQEPDDNPYDGVPAFFHGGMSYSPAESLRFTAYGGKGVNSAAEGYGGLKIAYNF